jgi:heme-degrading monooxygenase HmoA
MGYTYLWEFIVAPEHVAEFEQVYGPAGPWVVLFRQSAGYLGTHLLRDQSDPLRFVTIDRWRSASEHHAFRAAFDRQYRELDQRCQRLTTREISLGSFEDPHA